MSLVWTRLILVESLFSPIRVVLVVLLGISVVVIFVLTILRLLRILLRVNVIIKIIFCNVSSACSKLHLFRIYRIIRASEFSIPMCERAAILILARATKFKILAFNSLIIAVGHLRRL